MANVKLTGKLPNGQTNGLDKIAGGLVADPLRYRVVIGIIDCSKTETDNDIEQVIPTVRFRRIAVVAPDDVKTARRLMARAHEATTGQTVIPIELEEDLEALGSDG
jgi:hypothetical protein